MTIDGSAVEERRMSDYLAAREEVYGAEKAAKRPDAHGHRDHRGAKYPAKSAACSPELDESEEINACSIHDAPPRSNGEASRTGC